MQHEHYDRFLAAQYSWMAGGHANQVEKFRQFFAAAGFVLVAGPGHRALDLGCGSGFQSLALADLGYQVVAVDCCESLLSELRTQAGDRSIETRLGDMRDEALFGDLFPYDLAVCMGDSLLHLPETSDVAGLFSSVFHNLHSAGKLVLSFRDLSAELTGVERLVPVRLDDNRLMGTFLEYEPHHVNVHDFLFDRQGAEWKLTKSAYRKLRLSAARARELLLQAGFMHVAANMQGNFVTMIAQKTCEVVAEK